MTQLVTITEESHGVFLDLRYGTADNITGKAVYGRAACYLHPDADALLRRAIDLTDRQGLRLRIFDAYRPTEAQWVLWNHSADTTFLSDPRKGSPHSRGVAIDLTLVDGENRLLDMGTDFDDFSPKAFHGDTAVSPMAQRNRHLLLGIMTSAGWDCYLKEWWHYQLFQPRRYPLLTDSALQQPMMPQ